MLSFALTEEQMEDFATMVNMNKAFIK